MADTDPLDLLDPDERAGLRPAAARFVSPMLATLTADHFSDPGWLYERKLDGVRAVVVRDGDGTTIWSRSEKSMTGTYPEIAEALGRGPALVADGEIVAFDGPQTSFSTLQARLGLHDPDRARATGVAVFVYLFDVMVVSGCDVTGLPLRTRKRLLRAAVDFADPVRFSTHRNTDGEAYLAEACARGWEGLIAKRADSGYRPGRRSDDWLKFTCVREQEFVVGGWTDPAGSRQGFGALLVGVYDGDGLHYAGKVGTGFDGRVLHRLRELFDGLAADRSPFAGAVREKGTHWLRPELVAQIGFTEWTRDGRLRHPRYLGLRDDKDPREVVREEPRA
ncbi:non-homologous end-joining DNA ligase [Pseudonocardia sp. NPDC049154]|uniref:non-homologous end-joining DNA ligase n=1 Tax=Pseudonocardia sp. NPDC049154 TaxID=3155501 RepID=UPI0033C8D7CD